MRAASGCLAKARPISSISDKAILRMVSSVLLGLLMSGCIMSGEKTKSGTTSSSTGAPPTASTPATSSPTSNASSATSSPTAPSTIASQSVCVPSGKGVDYQVGDGKPYASLDQVPWESLNAGDTVRIYYRTAPYPGKFLISAQGTLDAPVRICGVRGPNGERPIIDGNGAVSRRTLAVSYGNNAYISDINQARSVISIKQDHSKPNYWAAYPTHIQIAGLHITRGHPTYSFLDTSGLPKNYAQFSACVWIDRGHNIRIEDNEISDCSQAIFSKSTDEGDFALTKNLHIRANHMWGHGVVGSSGLHTTYTQSVGTIIEFNRYSPLRTGALGNGPKDRSVGTVIRFNRLEGGSHAIDLVEAQDYPIYALSDPAYRTTFVYGNQIIKSGESGSFIHYGGDTPYSAPGNNWGEPIYRKGTLYFFNNTVRVTGRYGHIFRIDTTDETVEAWNNVFIFDESVMAGGRAMRAKRDVGAYWTPGGILNLGRNWVSTGWSDADMYHPVLGQMNGAQNMIVGSTPPVDLVTLHPIAGSAIIDMGQLSPAAASAHPVNFQLRTDFAPEARPVNGSFSDIGARER
jgi:hypothetical protein